MSGLRDVIHARVDASQRHFELIRAHERKP